MHKLLIERSCSYDYDVIADSLNISFNNVIFKSEACILHSQKRSGLHVALTGVANEHLRDSASSWVEVFHPELKPHTPVGVWVGL